MQKFYIIRGLPGSGKSTLARQLASSSKFEHFEADMFFYENGVYNFDRDRLMQAHDWCQTNTDRMLGHGMNVIVSNTFTTIKEMKPYFVMAKQYAIVPTVIHCQSNFGSIHGVPDEIMERMRTRFVHDIRPLFEYLSAPEEPHEY